MRELVNRRGWLTMEAFLADVAMAQALPGVNVVNLPIWIGYRLYGGKGALVCALAAILPAAVVLMLLAALVLPLQRFHQTALAFEGGIAAAIGLLIAAGLQGARSEMRRPQTAGIVVATFLAVGVLKLPMVPVMAVLAPLSILLAAKARTDA
jgi:chromate transporter